LRSIYLSGLTLEGFLASKIEQYNGQALLGAALELSPSKGLVLSS